MSQLLPSSLEYYHYAGSLSRPPCTEGIEWVVLKHHVTLSAAQLGRFPFADNSRPLQDRAGRLVEYLSPDWGTAPPTAQTRGILHSAGVGLPASAPTVFESFKLPAMWKCLREARLLCGHSDTFHVCLKQLSTACSQKLKGMVGACHNDMDARCKFPYAIKQLECLSTQLATLSYGCQAKCLPKHLALIQGAWQCYARIRSLCGAATNILFLPNLRMSAKGYVSTCLKAKAKLMATRCMALPRAMDSCRSEMRTLCWGVVAPAEVLSCLHARATKLGSRCLAALKLLQPVSAAVTAAPGAPPIGKLQPLHIAVPVGNSILKFNFNFDFVDDKASTNTPSKYSNDKSNVDSSGIPLMWRCLSHADEDCAADRSLLSCAGRLPLKCSIPLSKLAKTCIIDVTRLCTGALAGIEVGRCLRDYKLRLSNSCRRSFKRHDHAGHGLWRCVRTLEATCGLHTAVQFGIGGKTMATKGSMSIAACLRKKAPDFDSVCQRLPWLEQQCRVFRAQFCDNAIRPTEMVICMWKHRQRMDAGCRRSYDLLQSSERAPRPQVWPALLLLLDRKDV